MKKNGIGSHQSARFINDEWLTPPEIIQALGRFDLDPCSPVNRPWPTAFKHFTINDDGLQQSWIGRVWCNPPYGQQTAKWLMKLAEHGNGIALVFARTETRMFFDHVWSKAHSVLFIKGRLNFYDINGVQARMNSGAPSVLISYDEHNSEILKHSGIEGKFISL